MKLNRADIIRELVEEIDNLSDKREWRKGKKGFQEVKSLRESKSPKGKDKRRAWKLARAVRRGEYDFTGEKTKQNTHEDLEDE